MRWRSRKDERQHLSTLVVANVLLPIKIGQMRGWQRWVTGGHGGGQASGTGAPTRLGELAEGVDGGGREMINKAKSW